MVTMTAKRRYRLRQKLQTALLRVVEVVEELKAAGVTANTVNLVTTDTAMRILERFVHGSMKNDEPVIVLASGQAAMMQAMKRRVVETSKRKVRAASRKRHCA